MLTHFLPNSLVQHLLTPLPFRLWREGQPVVVPLHAVAATTWAGQQDDLHVYVRVDYDERYQALRWEILLHNQGQQPIEQLTCVPLYLELDVAPERDFPRVRHLSGSYHYDAAYPPRAFRLHEERFMTHDHSKPVRIAGGYPRLEGEHMVSIAGSAGEHVPVMECALGPFGSMQGFFVGFEWSSRWHIEAGWARNSFQGEKRPPFVVQGNTGLSTLRLDPGEVLALPAVHLGFVEGKHWADFDNALRRYVRNRLAAQLRGEVPLNPVSYDHWFGIHQDFNVVEGRTKRFVR